MPCTVELEYTRDNNRQSDIVYRGEDSVAGCVEVPLNAMGGRIILLQIQLNWDLLKK